MTTTVSFASFLVFVLNIVSGIHGLSSVNNKNNNNNRNDWNEIPSVFPVSTRQALMDKAYPRGSYSPAGWSNRVGAVLTPVSIPGVYTADRPFYWNGIDVGCRMTLIELSGRHNNEQQEQKQEGKPQVFVHSPVGLDGPLQEALQDYAVQHIVSPNYEHVKFAKQWAEAYPDSKVWACPGLSEKERQTRWTGEIPYGIRPGSNSSMDSSSTSATSVAEWKKLSSSLLWDTSEIQALHVDCEVNPFTGKPFFNEVVFYHTASKTLLVTDLYWNYPNGDGVTNSFLRGKVGAEDNGPWELAPSVPTVPIGSRLWKVGMDKLFQPFYMNWMIKEKKDKFRREICKTILQHWDVETVIPAHGDIIRGKTLIQAVLKEHFQL